MMADTYAMLSGVRRGVYNYSVLSIFPSYKLDKCYGGLIAFCYPYSMFGFLTLPFYCCIKDKKRLQRMTKTIYYSIYTPFLIIISVIFLAFNLIMMPFAFLKTLIHKILIVSRGEIPFYSIFSYLVIGLPLLILSQFTDLWAFIKSSFFTRKRY